jgi:GNAT superfamily N-acetyltransferase
VGQIKENAGEILAVSQVEEKLRSRLFGRRWDLDLKGMPDGMPAFVRMHDADNAQTLKGEHTEHDALALGLIDDLLTVLAYVVTLRALYTRGEDHLKHPRIWAALNLQAACLAGDFATAMAIQEEHFGTPQPDQTQTIEFARERLDQSRRLQVQPASAGRGAPRRVSKEAVERCRQVWARVVAKEQPLSTWRSARRKAFAGKLVSELFELLPSPSAGRENETITERVHAAVWRKDGNVVQSKDVPNRLVAAWFLCSPRTVQRAVGRPATK